MEMVEDHAGRTNTTKSRRTAMNETETTEPMTTSMFSLGAKSFCERDTTDGLRRETTNWVELKKKESGRLPGDLTGRPENE